MTLAPLADEEIAALGEGRAVIRDGALGEGPALACRAAIAALDASGGLAAAGVGREKRRDLRVRGDRIAWLEEGADPALKPAWALFEALRQELNAAAWLGLARFEVQAAVYGGAGEGYVRHRDAFARDPSRRVTAILYLNPGWRPEHGGELRVWEPEGPRDVAPALDRLVLFRSEALEHAVLPARRERFALTAWFRGREDVPP